MSSGRAAACRFCDAPLEHVFVDLGMSPLANSYLEETQLTQMEPFFPLRALVCAECFLVQLEDYESPEAIFSDYAYFSSFSSSWLDHARRFAEMAVERFELDGDSLVVEVASNDGYLLRWFRDAGVPVLGVEPAANVAAEAVAAGVPTRVEFFGLAPARALREQGDAADLIVGNNVLAHVPDLNDFVGGLKIALAPGGVISMEFPHLMRLIDEHQFDTIYHEHFSYFSFSTARRVLAAHGLRVWNVEEIPTHGGSLRVFACHDGDGAHTDTDRVAELLERERAAGYDDVSTYTRYAEQVREEKLGILEFLVGLKRDGLSIAGYGAPAKGNTLLNYCGIRGDFLDFTVDRNPHKQGRFLPGTHVPISPPERIAAERPDVVLILPWNLRDEIMSELAFIREWGGRFAARAPTLTLFD